ncbi:MAG: epoxyqueuosine reductase QueH [Lachnospiraceae bacterium]
MESNQRNYQKELNIQLDNLPNHNQTLLLHSCCAPCSSYVLIYLRFYFNITVFYYNPNITNQEEYEKRVSEQIRLITRLNEEREPMLHPISYLEGPYEPESFYKMSQGLEHCAEGGERCKQCFHMRLLETARQAVHLGFDYYATTLTISPQKDAALLNRIGEQIAQQEGVAWLPSDFKKKGGYQSSIALSKEYELYRQNYCGCIYSKQQADRDRANREIGVKSNHENNDRIIDDSDAGRI